MNGIRKALRSAFQEFRENDEWQTTVNLRRARTLQIRELLADTDAIDLSTFNREVWVYDSGSVLHANDGDKEIEDASPEELERGLQANAVELHGNRIWGAGARVYGSSLRISDEDKLANVKEAIRILTETSLNAIGKARQVDKLPGFGRNSSTGLAMVFHPRSFAIFNAPSSSAVEQLGYEAEDLESFQRTAQELRGQLGAEDFLELDWFLYLIVKGEIEIDLPKRPPPSSLNVILYGPPGTGKTYSVRRRAVQIADSLADDKALEGVEARFRELREQGRVEFVTFHPSYSYEEFVEGFRYDVEKRLPMLHKGLFREIADRAANPHQSMAPIEGARIWKVSLGRIHESHVFERCMANGEIAVGWLHNVDLTDADDETIAEHFNKHHPTSSTASVDNLVSGISVGDYVAVFGSVETIRAVGIVTDEYAYRGEYESYQHVRPVRWLVRWPVHEEHNIVEMNGNRRLTLQTIYELSRIPLQEFVKLLPDQADIAEPYILIIDEINRGNISRIFGELITLIESDKRLGAPDELSVRLPYSGERFTVPPNLHIIGTMNTADRSIALLDVALRRRFEFEEMMPKVGVVRQGLRAGGFEEEQVEMVCEVFEVLNARVAALLDRDHQIGHSYFLGLSSIDDLHDTLYRRVFPLLQEYFYNDPERLERLLGKYSSENRTGFVERPVTVYGKGFVLDDEGERSWRFHRFDSERLESALSGTFLGS